MLFRYDHIYLKSQFFYLRSFIQSEYKFTLYNINYSFRLIFLI